MMVQRTENGQTTNRLGKLFEHNVTNVTLGSFTKYYQFGGRLIAMREGLSSSSSVSFFATDHLGSTAVTIWASGNVRARLRYKPWGEQRYAQYTTPTGYRYTSQRWDSGLGLYDYNARYYDPAIGKFISADTLVPDPAAPQAFNRYAYVLGNPLRYSDPTGHDAVSAQLTTDEAQMLVDSIDLLLTTNDDEITVLEFLMSIIGSATLGHLLGNLGGKGILQLLATAGFAVGATASTVIAHAVGVLASIAVGVWATWNSEANKNAIGTLGSIRNGLIEAIGLVESNGTVDIYAENNWLGGDTIQIQVGGVIDGGLVARGGIYHRQFVTGIINSAGKIMVSMIVDLANSARDQDNPIRYYKSGKTYEVSSYQWKVMHPRYGPLTVNKCQVYGSVCNG